MVNIEGIDKGALLAELFNNSAPMGMGIFQAHRGPQVMTHEQGREIVKATLEGGFGDDHVVAFPEMGIHGNNERLYFDYLFGRPLKVNLTGNEVREDLYDRDNGGPGTLWRIVERLRNNGEGE